MGGDAGDYFSYTFMAFLTKDYGERRPVKIYYLHVAYSSSTVTFHFVPYNSLRRLAF